MPLSKCFLQFANVSCSANVFAVFSKNAAQADFAHKTRIGDPEKLKAFWGKGGARKRKRMFLCFLAKTQRKQTLLTRPVSGALKS